MKARRQRHGVSVMADHVYQTTPTPTFMFQQIFSVSDAPTLQTSKLVVEWKVGRVAHSASILCGILQVGRAQGVTITATSYHPWMGAVTWSRLFCWTAMSGIVLRNALHHHLAA